jgi:myo-inositol 2-dehydrogenase / D-chiro-inositol 1-dehydrogenase
VKVAVIGAGRMGRRHAEILASHPEVDEVLVHDVDAGVAASTAVAVEGRVYNSPGEAIERSAAVVIASSTRSHGPLIDLAVEASRPIFVEKPLTLTLEESIAVVDLVERPSTSRREGRLVSLVEIPGGASAAVSLT